MYDVATLSWFIGISSILLLLLGYTYCVLFLVKYIYVKKILVPIVALVAFCSGSFYLGPTVSFLSLLFTGQNITANLYYILSYVWLPIGTIGIVVMALNVFYPKYQKIAVIFYGIIAVIFWIFMFGFTEQQRSVSQVEANELLDISHASVSLIITGLSLLSILFIDSGGFFFLSRKLSERSFPQKDIRKAQMISLGWFLFVASGVLDAVVPAESIGFIIFVRSLMIIAFNFIYLGFWSKPTRINE